MKPPVSLWDPLHYVLPLVSPRAAPPYSLKPVPDSSPSLRVVGKDKDDGQDSEGESEEDPLESNPELNIDIDMDYDSN